jgi:signal recognition particle receptor subunit beta
MSWIFRATPWMLATVVVSVMTHAAAAGSFTRGCAARDLQLLIAIEQQELTGAIPAEKISEALLEMMHARIVCHSGRVLDALAIYDAVTESIQPIRSGRAEIK